MSKRKTEPKQSVRFTDRAEAFLNKNLADIKKTPPVDIRNLFEDMLIYQAELEKHNKELREENEGQVSGNETMYRRLAESATDLICVINMDGLGFDYASPSIASMSGYTLDEFMGLNLYEVLTPDSVTDISKVLEREIKKEKRGKAEPQRLELEGIDKDGSILWVEASVRFLRDNSGQVTSILCVARDITRRKETEGELKASEEKYRHLVSHMSDGLAMQDGNGLLTYVNDRFCEISGYPYDEAVGMKVMDLLDERNQKIVKEQVVKRKQELPAEPYEVELTRKDKTKLSLLVSPKGLFDLKGQYKGSFAIFSDITFLKLTENMLMEAKEQLEEKVRERTTELEEKNIALKVLLGQRGDDKKKLEETMMSNVKELLLPGLSRLKAAMPDTKQQAALHILEANLNEIISPFADNGSTIYMKLTPMEVQVANYIKHGASSKKIAESLGLSQRTVDTHRYNIRKKIGISGKGTNLRTYLSTLS